MGKGAAGNAELARASPCRPPPCQGWAGPGQRCSWTHCCRKPASEGRQMGSLINRNTSKARIHPHTHLTIFLPLPIPFLARCSCSGSGFREMRRLGRRLPTSHSVPLSVLLAYLRTLACDSNQRWVQLPVHLCPGPAHNQPWHGGGRHGLSWANSAFPSAPLPTIIAPF